MSDSTPNLLPCAGELRPGAMPAGCTGCDAELADLVTHNTLQARFRPVCDITACRIFAYLASVHGPAGTLLYAERRLVTAARHQGMGNVLTRLFFAAALRGYRNTSSTDTTDAQPAAERLILPLPWGLPDGEATARELLATLQDQQISPDRIIIAHPGVQVSANPAADLPALRQLLAAGMSLATASLGCDHSEHALWQHLAPRFVLLDDGLLEGQDSALAATSRLGSLLQQEQAQGRRVIACGVGSAADLRALAALQIDLGAGDFIGRPYAEPVATLSAAAHKLLMESHPAQAPNGSRANRILAKLLTSTAPVSPETSADEVFAMFENTRDLRAVAVVKDHIPVGLISRYDMVDNMARPYRHELYGRKSCSRFMEADPLVVDVGLSLQDLSNVLVEAHPRHLISGFIITDHGHFLGMGSVQDLVREVTHMQLEAARYANPLTQLPGNVPINNFIDSLLAVGDHCTICYCDLDHFKPFNDVYGYARGDDVIRLTARVLESVCDPERDFLGHIGGDDFIAVFRSEDWQDRCQQALARFGGEVLGFFSPDDVERGGYITENRKGRMEFHALTSLSIGAVEAPPRLFGNHLEISTVASEVKRRAKGIPGNSLFINQRHYERSANGNLISSPHDTHPAPP